MHLAAPQWDRAGRMSELLTVDNTTVLATYGYDDRDYRFRVTTDYAARTVFYVRDSAGQVLTEFAKPSSVAEPQWRKDYIYALGRHIAVVENAAPETPAGLMSSADCCHVNLSWMDVASPDLFGYDVYRATAAQPENFIRLTLATPQTAIEHTDEMVDEGETYFYRIGSVDDAWVTSELTAPRKIKAGDVIAPMPPTNFNMDEAFCSFINLSWNLVDQDFDDESDIVGYNLYRRNYGDTVWPATPRNGAVLIQTSGYSDVSGTTTGAVFQYGVETVDAAGNKSPKTTVVVYLAACGGGGGGGMAELHHNCSAPRTLHQSPGTECGEGSWIWSSDDETPPGSESPHRIIGDQPEVTYVLRYYHVDHLGTPRVITDAAGAVVAKAAFFPFGEDVPGSTSGGNTHWFTGHERDFLAGQDYMLARSYSPTVARFYSPDPISSTTRAAVQDGLYIYVRNAPTILIDPSGKEFVNSRCRWKAVGTVIGNIFAMVGLGATGNPYATAGGVILGLRGIIGGLDEVDECEKEEAEAAEKRAIEYWLNKCIDTKDPGICALVKKYICDKGKGDLNKCEKVEAIVNPKEKPCDESQKPCPIPPPDPAKLRLSM